MANNPYLELFTESETTEDLIADNVLDEEGNPVAEDVYVDEDGRSYTNEAPQNQEEGTYTLLAQSLFEYNGWQYDPSYMETDSPDAYNELISNIIEENSVPEYGNDFVRDLDEYVKKGGNPKVFVDLYYGEADTSNFHDLKSEEGQADIMFQHYKLTTKWSDEKIHKEVNRLYVSGDLETEAVEALEHLRAHEEQKKYERAQKAEEILEQETRERQRYQNQIVSMIREANEDTLGITMSRREKENFLDYIFSTDPKDNLTKYQKYLRDNPNAELKLALLAFKGVAEGKIPQYMQNKIVTELTNKLKSSPAKFATGSSVNVKYKKTADNPYLDVFDE